MFPNNNSIIQWFISIFNFSKKEDWNAIVRQNTMSRDPIGSTRNSVRRRDNRQSLRRQILEEANKGLMMDTDKVVGKIISTDAIEC